ncbi:MAG: helix-turn-helix domain-containing protein [Nitrospira sp.]|nr:helix-turn-helix domain-containing protein [Nitrospira sp.]
MQELLTPSEVATYFRIKQVRTVYEWISRGLFPNVRLIQRQYRIPKADVEAYDEQCRLSAGTIQPIIPTRRRVISSGIS